MYITPSSLIERHIKEVIIPNTTIDALLINWTKHDFKEYVHGDYEIVTELEKTKSGRSKYLCVLTKTKEEFKMSNCTSLSLNYGEGVIYNNIFNSFRTFTVDITIWENKKLGYLKLNK